MRKIFTKSNMKGLARVLSVILSLVIILQTVSLGAFSKLNATTYKNCFTRAYSFLSEPEASIDVSAIGSSNLYSAFVPMLLFEDKGLTSTVISSPHQTALKSYEFLKELLKTQSPKLLIIETDMLYENAPPFNSESKQSGGCGGVRAGLAGVLDNFDYQVFEDAVTSNFSVFRFHDRWKTIKIKDIICSGNAEKPETIDHGYNFNNSVKPAKANNNMAQTDISEPIPCEALIYLDKMLEICGNSGIAVLLVEMPTQNSWNYYRHNAVSEYAESKGIRFVDFNLLFDEIGFDIEKDYRDGGDHCNYWGAGKTTGYLAGIISSDYLPGAEDKRLNPQYAYWIESNKKFREKYNV